MIENYNDEMVDIAIKYAGREIFADAGANCTDVWAQSPARLDNAVSALARREAAGRHAKAALRVTVRVAAILAVIIVISTGAVFSSKALRAQVMNLFYVEKEGSTEISFGNGEEVQLPVGMTVPGFIPYGFKLIETQEEGDGIIIMCLYENEAGEQIRIQQLPIDANIGVDNDNAYETQVAGRTAYVSEEKESVVVFNNDWNSFIISGMAPVEDLLAMAESILQ